MVKSEHKRQQKLARKQAKDRKRHQQEIIKRQQMSSLGGQMTLSAGGKLLFCGVGDMSEGLCYVGLARLAPNGSWACSLFLVDRYCLGVKNVAAGFWDENMRKRAFGNLEPVAPDVARGLVESSIEFAARAGIKPYGDYAKVAPLWGDIQRGSIEGQYELGKDGKHFYIAGPFDDAARQRAIVSLLQSNLGTGNFHYVVGGPRSSESLEQGYPFDEFDDGEDQDVLENVEYLRIDKVD